MNLLNRPELLDRLAAAHALGTLRGGARRRFETLARREPHVRATALVWQGRLAGLVELQPSVAPPPEVWTRIDTLVQQQAQAEAAAIVLAGSNQTRAEPPTSARAVPMKPAYSPREQAPWWSRLAFWRGLATGGALAAGVALFIAFNLRAGLEQQIARLRGDVQTQAQRADAAQALLANTQRVDDWSGGPRAC